MSVTQGIRKNVIRTLVLRGFDVYWEFSASPHDLPEVELHAIRDGRPPKKDENGEKQGGTPYVDIRIVSYVWEGDTFWDAENRVLLEASKILRTYEFGEYDLLKEMDKDE